jgi:hypothetical protein
VCLTSNPLPPNDCIYATELPPLDRGTELVVSEYHWTEDVELTEKIRLLREKKLKMLKTSR